MRPSGQDSEEGYYSRSGKLGCDLTTHPNAIPSGLRVLGNTHLVTFCNGPLPVITLTVIMSQW